MEQLSTSVMRIHGLIIAADLNLTLTPTVKPAITVSGQIIKHEPQHGCFLLHHFCGPACVED